MKGTEDGNNGTDKSVPTPASDPRDSPHDLDRRGDPDERPDRPDGAEPASGDAGDADGSKGDDSSEQEQVQREIAREASLEAIEMLVSSGPIADAENFYKYTPDHQERLIRMAEAPRTDESRRRDLYSAAQVVVIKRSQWIQAVLFAGCLVGTAVSFWIFHEAIGAVFLGLPVMQAVSALMKQVDKR